MADWDAIAVRTKGTIKFFVTKRSHVNRQGLLKAIVDACHEQPWKPEAQPQNPRRSLINFGEEVHFAGMANNRDRYELTFGVVEPVPTELLKSFFHYITEVVDKVAQQLTTTHNIDVSVEFITPDLSFSRG